MLKQDYNKAISITVYLVHVFKYPISGIEPVYRFKRPCVKRLVTYKSEYITC